MARAISNASRLTAYQECASRELRGPGGRGFLGTTGTVSAVELAGDEVQREPHHHGEERGWGSWVRRSRLPAHAESTTQEPGEPTLAGAAELHLDAPEGPEEAHACTPSSNPTPWPRAARRSARQGRCRACPSPPHKQARRLRRKARPVPDGWGADDEAWVSARQAPKQPPGPRGARRPRPATRLAPTSGGASASARSTSPRQQVARRLTEWACAERTCAMTSRWDAARRRSPGPPRAARPPRRRGDGAAPAGGARVPRGGPASGPVFGCSYRPLNGERSPRWRALPCWSWGRELWLHR